MGFNFAGAGPKGGEIGLTEAKSNSAFDSSGWNVNFGSGSVTSSPAMSTYLPYVILGAGLLVVWRMTKK